MNVGYYSHIPNTIMMASLSDYREVFIYQLLLILMLFGADDDDELLSRKTDGYMCATVAGTSKSCNGQ